MDAALTKVATALAQPTACDRARITSWKIYHSCVDTVLQKVLQAREKVASDVRFDFDFSTAFWECRHAYFKEWATFQTDASLAGSTCIGNRFTVTDSGLTETDGLTGLVWELKTNSGMHKGSNTYTWSTDWNKEDGTAFTTFLTPGLNTPGFAGANGWRLPTLTELQTILADFPSAKSVNASCVCLSSPCVALSDPNARSGDYWSATTYAGVPVHAWFVSFDDGFVTILSKNLRDRVRAVRSGF